MILFIGAVIVAKSLAYELSWAKAIQQDLLQKQLKERPPLSQADCKETGTVFARDDCLNCRPNCYQPEDNQNCTREVCAMSCVCPEGYTRRPSDFDHSCIPLSECPKCPLNEVYDTVDDDREPSCENPTPQRKSPCGMCCRTLVCVMRWEPPCTCADGYVRNKTTGKCILLSECPDSS
ncbi:cysteine-rich venom protein 6-like [Ditylenchus destructor]|nr:cysteine-rich venom protein 6-like [Ditylenchus destructor]